MSCRMWRLLLHCMKGDLGTGTYASTRRKPAQAKSHEYIVAEKASATSIPPEPIQRWLSEEGYTFEDGCMHGGMTVVDYWNELDLEHPVRHVPPPLSLTCLHHLFKSGSASHLFTPSGMGTTALLQ